MELTDLFSRLSREPDFDAPELQAHDAADLLLLETAAGDLGSSGFASLAPGDLAVVGDRHGALTLGAAALGAEGIRTHQDPLLGERALQANAARVQRELAGGPSSRGYTSQPLSEDLLAGARVVLVQLPRGLDALDEIAWSVARWAAPGVRVYAGGRVKHMSLGQNAVLSKYFGEVRAGLARRKARVLTAGSPQAPGSAPFPRWGSDPDLPFRIAAHGATFGGPALDRGSRLLLRGLASAAPRAARIVDLGCGNGVLAVAAALARPGARVIATDQSSAAVAASRLTADAAGVGERVEIHRADALKAVPDGWAELILLNPPFHTGATVHAGIAHRLIRACREALAPGGELRLVFNSHLRYRPLVEREIGPTRQVARDRAFTVLAAERR